MRRSILLAFQLAAGGSDTATGALLMAAPATTLALMRLHVPEAALVYIAFIGSFVFSVGLAYLYGALLVARNEFRRRLEAVWLLTAITRASVAMFVVSQVFAHALEAGWLTVAATDGTLVLIQAVGLRKRWLSSVAQ